MFACLEEKPYLRIVNQNYIINMKRKIKAEPKGLTIDIARDELALQLHMYRLRRGLTQHELGKLWDCSRYTIMRAEKGRPISWEQAYKLFYYLNQGIIKESNNP